MSESAAESETVDVAGPPDAAPLVLVHGTVFNRSMWAPQREALADEFRVIAPDLPGHGSRRDESFDLASGVATVADAVQRHADGPVHLVGLSLGGYVATAFARRHPDQVERLVVSGASANPVGVLGTATRLAGRTLLLASRSGLVERGVARLAGWWVEHRDLPSALREEIVGSGFDLEPAGEAGLEIAGVDFRSAFGAFDGPALVLNGQWDLVSRRGEDAHATAARDARIATIRGAGHTCNLERARSYESALRRFLNDEL